jgi:hypothetical protein
MKTPKRKCYVMMLAKQFPAHHYKKGQPTSFKYKAAEDEKIHTIRINVGYWKKRIDEVNARKAYISIREWSDKPYQKGSSQPELFRMYKCGYELICKTGYGYLVTTDIEHGEVDGKPSLTAKVAIEQETTIAQNDGLEVDDFNSWFAKIDTKEQLIIIHFTDYRYTESYPGSHNSYLIPTQN